MSQASKIAEHQILLNMAEMTRIDGELMGMSDNHPLRADREGRLATVKEATRGWQQRYFALTGVRWTSVEITEPLHIKVNGQQVWQEEQMRQANAYKSQVMPTVRKQMIEAYQERIREVDIKLFRLKAQVHDATKWPELSFKGMIEETGKGFTENFVLLERSIPWEVTKTLPDIEAALQSASSALERERTGTQFRETHRNLMQAADLINLGLAAMERYHNAMQKGGQLAIAYIKWTSIIVTFPLSGAPGIAVTGLAAVRLAVAGKASEEGATLLARYLCGEKLTNADLRKALGEVALAGATSAAGEIAGRFAGPVAAKVFGTKTPTAAQIAMVKDKLPGLISNNLELALKAVVNLSQGKKVEWDVWASLVAPLLPPEAGAIVKEKDIRDGVSPPPAAK